MGAAERKWVANEGRKAINSAPLTDEDEFEALKAQLLDLAQQAVDDFEENRANLEGTGLFVSWDEKQGWKQDAWESLDTELSGIDLRDFETSKEKGDDEDGTDWDAVRDEFANVWSNAADQ